MHGVCHPVLLAGGRRAPGCATPCSPPRATKGGTPRPAAPAAGDATLVDLLLDLSHGDCPGDGDSDDDGDGGDNGDGGDGDGDGDGGGGDELLVDAMEKSMAGESALHLAVAGEHREVVALLLKRTHLPLDGPSAANNDGLVPLQCCSAAFRNDVESLAEMIHEDHAALRRSVGTRRLLHGGRYLLCSVISPKVQLAQDLQRGGRSVALKYYATSEEAEHEEQVMRLVGPQTAPEVYERFYDESGCGERRHVLAMQAADVLSDLALFCQRERVLQGRLSLRHYALKLLQCVHALHKKGMVHTDIKTKHFMRFGGEWKLVDYDNATMENETCQPSCTIRYAAPEVVAARVGAGVVKVTRAVDAWAMGHVLYDLFAGEPLLSTDDGEVELEALHADPEAAVRKLHAAGKHLLTEPQKRLLASLLVTDAEKRTSVDRVLNKSFFKENEDTEQSRQLEVLALFSSPTRWKTGHRIQPLKLMKEIGFLQEAIPHRLRDIRPAACFPADIKKAVQELSPRVLQFSGHGDALRRGPMAGALAFEMADGTIQLPDPDDFIELLGPASCPHLQCVFLNGCKTVRPLGDAIVAALPHLTVIGWDSITLDAACAAFSLGFYDELGKGCDPQAKGRAPSMLDCYRAAERAFLAKGFQRGDPELDGKDSDGRPTSHGKYVILPEPAQETIVAPFRRALTSWRVAWGGGGGGGGGGGRASGGPLSPIGEGTPKFSGGSHDALVAKRGSQEEPLPTRPQGVAVPPARRKITTAPH